jgi:hypothetical protein
MRELWENIRHWAVERGFIKPDPARLGDSWARNSYLERKKTHHLIKHHPLMKMLREIDRRTAIRNAEIEKHKRLQDELKGAHPAEPKGDPIRKRDE